MNIQAIDVVGNNNLEAIGIITATVILFIQSKRSERKVNSKMADINKSAEKVVTSVTENNGGTNIKDYLDRMESKQIHMYLEQQKQSTALEHISTQVNNVGTHVNTVDNKLEDHLKDTRQYLQKLKDKGILE